MKNNVKKLAKQYSRSGDIKFPKDIWELILLRKKEKQLCKRLGNEENKYILINFALMLDIPIPEYVSKRKLCDIVSKQISYGERYGESSVDYFKRKQAMKKAIKGSWKTSEFCSTTLQNMLPAIVENT